MGQSLVKNYLHIVFSTKHRKPLIHLPVETELHSYLGGICKNLECHPLIVGGHTDHIHILCMLSKKIVLMDLLEELKSHSSKWIKTKGDDYANFYWQNGYGAFSVNPAEVEVVRNYIANQKEHHRKKNFQDEYRAFLEMKSSRNTNKSMKTFFSITLLIFLFACSNSNQTKESSEANKSNHTEKILIDSLVATIDVNSDMLHSDFTPSVHRLSELGIPAIVAVLPLLNNEKQDTRLHAQRVAEGVVMQMHGFVPGQGFSNNPLGEDSATIILKSIGYNYSDLPEQRQKAIENWRKWIDEMESE